MIQIQVEMGGRYKPFSAMKYLLVMMTDFLLLLTGMLFKILLTLSFYSAVKYQTCLFKHFILSLLLDALGPRLSLYMNQHEKSYTYFSEKYISEYMETEIGGDGGGKEFAFL